MIRITYRLIPLEPYEPKERLVDALLEGGFYRIPGERDAFVPGVTLTALLGLDWIRSRYIIRRYGKDYAVFRKEGDKRERVTLLPVLVFQG